MRVPGHLYRLLLAGGGGLMGAVADDISTSGQQHVLHDSGAGSGPIPKAGISEALFADLERLARLVDITYCVGTTGISPPFTCASRCGDFPGVQLVTTWNTGALLTDSCGYVAVDHTADSARTANNVAMTAAAG
ncbi:triacylglycerol lipase FGL2, partial [Magnaporthiopsis poae ATCC 64411]